MTLREHLLIDAEIFRKHKENAAFRASNPGYPVPPIAFMCDAHGNWDYEEYRRSGIKAAAIIAASVKAFGPTTTGLSIYEWGCGPARIIRHLREQLGPDNRYLASDYNRPCVEWCAQAINGIEFFANDLNPPVALESGSVDVVYCRSVFTHLTKANTLAWMEELKRVTRPGGLIWFSTHSDTKLAMLERSFPGRVAEYKRGEVVELERNIEGRREYASFHPPSFVRGEMLNGLSLLDHSATNQDQWVARR